MKHIEEQYKLRDIDLLYRELVYNVMAEGDMVHRRNGLCRTLAGQVLKFYVFDTFPLLLTRKVNYKAVFGELAAMVREPKHINDFKKWGCNYWDQFGDKDGNLAIDYGNAWLHPVNQLENAMKDLKYNPQSRRIIIDGWRPENVDNLTLPCCHFLYQYVVINNQLYLNWYQRSADIMVGIPSDIILATLLLLGGAVVRNYRPVAVTMFLGDAHIYEQHVLEVGNYLKATENLDYNPLRPGYKLHNLDLQTFDPSMVEITKYKEDKVPKFKFECIK